MNKIKAICVNNIIRDHPLDEERVTPFTIGKIYEVSVITNQELVWPYLSISSYQEWAWVFIDLNRMGHYPMILFKTLEDHREEILNQLI